MYKYWVAAVSLKMKTNQNSDLQYSHTSPDRARTDGGQKYMCVENMTSKKNCC